MTAPAALSRRAEKLLAVLVAEAADAPRVPASGLGEFDRMLALDELEKRGMVERADGELYLAPAGATYQQRRDLAVTDR